jgi:hypothetical protein
MASKMSSERGAILIHVAVASVVLIAFSMFVIDYGVMWVSRGQAQNAADSGALAGAVALGFDDFGNRNDDGPAKQAALRFALNNGVFGESPDVDVETDVIFYDDDPAKFPDECADDTCIRVDVYRNQDRLNPLPMMFGQLVGLNEQGVRATAIARAAFGSATNCLKPWAVIDKWEEHWENGAPATRTWDQNSDETADGPEFDKYLDSGGDQGELDPDITDPDVYQPPSVEYNEDGTMDLDTYVPGTGFHPFNPDRSYTSDYGRRMVLKVGSDGDFQFGSGWFMALALQDSTGGSDYRQNILGCPGITYQIGDELEISTEPGEKVGPTRQGVEGGGSVDVEDSLVGRDPDAYWDPDIGPIGPDGTHLGGVAGSAFETSPRIVAIPLVNPELVVEANKGGRTTVPIANIAGFFVEGMDSDGKGVVGYLVTLPGLLSAGTGSATPSSFLVNISLVR